MHHRAWSARVRSRGFTLLELMTVVVIIGILAALAIYSVRGYIQSSKTAEAREIIGSIKAGEEAYFDEVFKYLNVSDLSTYHPIANTDGRVKADWRGSSCSGCLAAYRTLGVEVPAPVMFRYATAAAVGELKDLPLPDVTGTPFAAAPAGPYYVVKAISDLDGKGAKTVFLSSNYSAEIYSENVGQ
ncbi:MAG TPA: prepilin-type N-terminal cleavage/methylation domain-containing protein [Polyangiaceae bacterium]|nr:prepilin-type N-terminal cleavage/methylation domain-containing protein [Polyangiaceae bacterium]